MRIAQLIAAKGEHVVADSITLSVIKADIGGFVGHCSVHSALVARARQFLGERGADLLIDWSVLTVGDDLVLVMTHRNGQDNPSVHQMAWDLFWACTEVARSLKLYGAGQDLLADAFSGNIKGLGPGVAEMEFVERLSEPVVIFAADKTEPGAWNLPLYKMFADPFNTSGLVIDGKMHKGFRFEVHDLVANCRVFFDCPEEIYDMLVFIGASSRYCIKSVHSRTLPEPGASSSTQKLNLLAGRYIGKDDPVCIVRCQNGLPAVGEALEPFTMPHLVAGWMRGSHSGPLMPVGFCDATPTRFDGPPRVIAAGYQLAHGRLVGPHDFFADKSFDRARQRALEVADYMREMGPFEPHRLPLDAMEYTTLPDVMKRLKGRFEPIT